MSDVQVHFSSDAQLMGYGESDSSGAWIKFQVEADDLEHFRGLKGTVFNLTLVKYLDDGTPEPRKIHHMAEWFGARCREPEFWDYLAESYHRRPGTEDEAAEVVRLILKINSRADLDTDIKARERGQEFMRDYHEDMRLHQVG